MKAFNIVMAEAPATTARVWRPTTITSDDYSKKIHRPPADHKDCGGYVLGALRPTDDSGLLRRNKEAVVSRSALALDADKAQLDLIESLTAFLGGCSWIAHTTWSSAPEAPRWRVVIWLDRDVTPDEYERLARYVMRETGADQWDKTCAEPSRLMFWPSAKDPDHYRVHEVTGKPLPVDAWLADAVLDEPEPAPVVDRPAVASPLPADFVSARVADYLHELDVLADLPEGARDDHGDGWDAGVFRVACQLVRAANSGYGLDAAEDAFYGHAPTGGGFGSKEVRDKWESALRTVGGEGLAWDDPADDFEALPEAAPTVDRFDADVARELHRLRVQQAARETLAREKLAGSTVPPVRPLAELLDEPDEEVAFRVEGLWPLEGRVVLAAAQKAGKTTLVGNLTRSLVDGHPFMGQFAVKPVERVIILDNELSPRTIRQWLRDQGIENTRAVDVVALRGHLSAFNVLDPVTRTEWARRLGPADVLVFDCLRPMLDALGLSEDKDAGKVLEALDELTAEAGIAELFLVHHMGHSNERTRGDSRILDWPDAVWKLVREDSEVEHSPRYFRAHGRDVDQREVRLAFDRGTRHLSIDGGSRAAVRQGDLESDVLDFVRDNPGCSQNAIEREVTGKAGDLRAAIVHLASTGRLRIEKQAQKKLHFISLDEFEEAS